MCKGIRLAVFREGTPSSSIGETLCCGGRGEGEKRLATEPYFLPPQPEERFIALAWVAPISALSTFVTKRHLFRKVRLSYRLKQSTLFIIMTSVPSHFTLSAINRSLPLSLPHPSSVTLYPLCLLSS